MSVYFEPVEALTAMKGDVTFGVSVPSTTFAGQAPINVFSTLTSYKTLPLSACTDRQVMLWSPYDSFDCDLQPTTAATLVANSGAGANRNGQQMTVVAVGCNPGVIIGYLNTATCIECTVSNAYDFLALASHHKCDSVAVDWALNEHRALGPFIGFDK